jgi:hypothetical protein
MASRVLWGFTACNWDFPFTLVGPGDLAGYSFLMVSWLALLMVCVLSAKINIRLGAKAEKIRCIQI